MNRSITIICGFLLILFSCNLRENVGDDVVARIGDDYLLFSELSENVSKGLNKEDSLVAASSYIKKWLENKLMLQKAELNLKDDIKAFEQELEDYRRTLMVYAYEKELIREKLDTNVTDEEIEAYYNASLQRFKLKEDILQLKYAKFPIPFQGEPKLKELLTSEDIEQQEELRSYCEKYALAYHLDNSSWVTLNNFLKELPQLTHEKGFLRQKAYTQQQDSSAFYFIYTNDVKFKGDVAPIGYEKNNIKRVIINKRKQELKKQIRVDLYREALLKKEIEIYEKGNSH